MATADRETLVSEIVDLIVEAVNLRHKDKKEISAETALMQSGLELDSLDILEVVVAVENRFHVKITDPEEGQKVFRTIGSIADFVQAKSL